MDKETRINEEVDKTMGILDNVKILKGNPFFYTRLKARLEGVTGIQPGPEKRLFIALRPIGLILLLLLNIFTAVYIVNEKQTTTASSTNESGKISSGITDEYRFDKNCYIYNIKD